MRTQILFLEVYLSTFRTSDDLAGYLHAAARTYGRLVTDLMSAFRTFDDCHSVCCLFLYCLWLTVPETNLAHAVPSHEPAFVHIGVDAVDGFFL